MRDEQFVQRARRRRAQGRWHAMLDRCQNPDSPNWAWYGGRGITVCERWLDFDAYYADTGDAPDGTTLDRIDNDAPYEPGNVRWATPREQRANQGRVMNLPATVHGTVNGYDNRGCRCQPCRDAHAAAVRTRRAQRAQEEPPVHGRASTYTNWRCRCDDCRQAHRNSRKATA